MAAAEAVLTAGGAQVIRCTPQELPDWVKNGVNGAFCATDFQAATALGELLCSGLTVPNACAVIGYDDLVLASTVRPKLTSVRQPKDVYGNALAELLLERLEGKKARSVLLPADLVVRESTSPAH
jgi:LacI family transcriptional regulator